MPRLPPPADLSWTPDGRLRATRFDDIYFSNSGGLAEAEAVFLAGCDLPAAWRNKDRFALCELGFGSGINVLAAWRVWKKTRLPHAQLHISTVEAFPLAKPDAARVHDAIPELSEFSAQLLEAWPVLVSGPQRLAFPEDGLTLTVHIGDAEAVLAGMTGAFDAWFLDGFTPARNPQMWSPQLMRRIAALSAPDARLATFSVAGEVRRALTDVGFAVEKKPGFGSKRERLQARLLSPQAPVAWPLYPYAAAYPKRVAILGAGIAGASCAHALARRGVETIVLEEQREVAAGASGNPVGLVTPRFDRGETPLAEVFQAAYLHAVAAYTQLDAFAPCGVLQRAEPARAEALADILSDPPLPEDWMRPAEGGAALHPRAGLVRPRVAIEAMLRGAQVMCESPVAAIERADARWTLRAPDGRALLQADAIVIACGPALALFEPAAFLPIEISYGQIEWGAGPPPQHALTRGTYVAPFDDGVLFGATFDKSAPDKEDARARNLAALERLAPEIAAGVIRDTINSRMSQRATTPDRAPIAGLLPDAEAWRMVYAPLSRGAAIDVNAPPPAHTGIYVFGGLGARGLTLAPLLAERIVSEMLGEPQILSRLALEAIHPARFLHRALKRR